MFYSLIMNIVQDHNIKLKLMYNAEKKAIETLSLRYRQCEKKRQIVI